MRSKRADLPAITCRFEKAFYQRMDQMRAAKGESYFCYRHIGREVEVLAELGLREYMEMQRRLGAERASTLMYTLLTDFESGAGAWKGWSGEEAAVNYAGQLKEKGAEVPEQTPRKDTSCRIIPFPAASKSASG